MPQLVFCDRRGGVWRRIEMTAKRLGGKLFVDGVNIYDHTFAFDPSYAAKRV